MVNELQFLESIDINYISDQDKKDLLNIFMSTKDSHIRNRIALIFSDIHYNEAIPYIIKKINEKELFNYNGTLVYALEGLDTQDYFIDIINIVCNQEYEARLMAYELVEKYKKSISLASRNEALALLKNEKDKIEEISDDEYENSKLHFVESCIRLLEVKEKNQENP